MKNQREEWYDETAKVAVTMVDVSSAAQILASSHLCGPTAAYFLTKALAAAALLGAETSEAEESLSIQMKCDGPLGGFNVECTVDGKLRGYTDRKILDEFDILRKINEEKVLGKRRIQVTRTVPGRIISQGISNSLDGYLAGSLQRRAVLFTEAEVSEEVEILEARGVLVEALPDSAVSISEITEDLRKNGQLAVSSRKILSRLGLNNAERKRVSDLAFGCRCSQARAEAMVAALGGAQPDDGDGLCVTCHLCGKTYTVHCGKKETEQ